METAVTILLIIWVIPIIANAFLYLAAVSAPNLYDLYECPKKASRALLVSVFCGPYVVFEWARFCVTMFIHHVRKG